MADINLQGHRTAPARKTGETRLPGFQIQLYVRSWPPSGARRPGRAPARLHAGEADQRQHGERHEDQETGLIAAGELLRE